MKKYGEFLVDEIHPCLSGHFPGNPVVPGVLILQKVLRLFRTVFPQKKANEIVNVKFLHLIKPGLNCEICFSEVLNSQIGFSVYQNEVLSVTGTLLLTIPDEAI